MYYDCSELLSKQQHIKSYYINSRQATKANGSEKVDGKSSISWIITRKQPFKIWLQCSATNTITQLYSASTKLK